MLELLNDLAAARGAGVRVAVVDSGVEDDHPWVGGRLKESYRVDSNGGVYDVTKTDPVDVYGHGTAVAGQIRRFAPDVDIISVQILGGNLRANSHSLLKALRWLVTHTPRVDIINLSLSTMREELALLMSHAVDDLYSKNIACVCARGYHLTGKAYPTNFAGTIGVTYKSLPQAKVEFRPFDNVAFDASGIAVTVAWKGGETREIEGSSFACPLVTGLAAKILGLRRDLTPYELKTLLKAYADRQAGGWKEPWMDAVDKPPLAG
jgi:subtilisin family serine protease